MVDEGLAALAHLPSVGSVSRPIGLGYDLLVGLRVVGDDLPEEGSNRHLRGRYGPRVRLFADHLHKKILPPGFRPVMDKRQSQGLRLPRSLCPRSAEPPRCRATA